MSVTQVADDVELMLRVREGDETSFELLLERYRLPVYRYLYRMVHNQALAEELAQEVFLRVYKSRAGYEPTAKFTTWLYRIATHLAFNHLRDHRREALNGPLEDSPLPSPAPNTEARLLREAKLKEIRQAIEELPERQRSAVLLHKYEGLEYAQIASILGLTESALKSLLFRAYQTLRQRLKIYAKGIAQ
jgi:RNA polymerase sigma-70 factor (ECF subfamily)